MPHHAIDPAGAGFGSGFRTKTALKSCISGVLPEPDVTAHKLAASTRARQPSWLLNGDSGVEPMN
jgi:hypothetical protein